MRLRVAVCNVPISVGAKAWRECFTETAKRGDIFGINEAHSPRQKATYRRQAKRRRLRKYGLSGANPLFNDPDRWRRVHQGQHRLHGRGPLWRRWPGFNAARSATVAVYRSTGFERVPDVTVINTHLVPRGPKVPGPWRDRARRRAVARIARLTAQHVARHRVVVVMGDFNMDDAPAIPGVRWLVGARHGVDKIGVAVPKGWRIAERTTQRFPAPTDHKSGVAADLRIERV